MKFKNIENRKAKYEYTTIKTYDVGIVLKGSEVRSILDGHGTLQGSFAKIIKDEVFVFDMYVPNILNQNWNKHNEKEPKKLLLKRKEIISIQKEMNLNPKYTLVPTKVYYNGKIKIELALCYGNNVADKRDYIKDRDSKKEAKEY